jgi:hypothetical protein
LTKNQLFERNNLRRHDSIAEQKDAVRRRGAMLTENIGEKETSSAGALTTVCQTRLGSSEEALYAAMTIENRRSIACH